MTKNRVTIRYDRGVIEDSEISCYIRIDSDGDLWIEDGRDFSIFIPKHMKNEFLALVEAMVLPEDEL